MTDITVWDFESGDLGDGEFPFQKTSTANWPVIVTEPVRSGNYAMKSYVNRTEPKPYRTEIIPTVDIYGHSLRLTHHEEFYIGISIFVPDDFVVDANEHSEIVWQAHHHPDDWDNVPPECEQPLIAIGVKIDQWFVWVRGINVSQDWKILLDIGVWTDFTLRIIVSEGEDGLVQAWHNKKMFVDHRGSTTRCEFIKSPYIAFGIYKWTWIPGQEEFLTDVVDRTYYHDEFRIGKTYNEVQPPGESIVSVIDDLVAVVAALRAEALAITAQADAVAQSIVDLQSVDDVLDAAADVIEVD